MKVRVLIPVLALTILALQGCLKEQEIASEKAIPQMTIRVSMPEDATKAGFTVPGSGEGLHLAWKAGDVIRVISGANSAVYTIQDGFTDHVASFSGPEVAGDSFDIVVPGTYGSAAEAEAGNANLTQTGNGSTAHLVFTAKLTGVAKADLPEIGFTSDWVAAHAGTELKRGGIVKMVLTLPNAVTAPKKVVLRGIGDDIAVNVTGVSLASEHVLTVYAQSGWDDIALADNTDFWVDVFDADESRYSVRKTVAVHTTFKAGAQNIFTISDGFTEQLFYGGEGSQASPYLIANAKQLDNMHVDGVLKHNEKVYFRVIKDIDMQSYLTSHTWVPLNKDNPYDYLVDFDGDGHTIDHFSITTNATNKNPQTGFFGVLYGDAYNVIFTNASVTNSYGRPTGILCGFCGYSGKMAHVYNVHVNGDINFTGNNSELGNADKNGPVGGMIGRVHTCLVESSSAFDMNIRSSRSYSGGLFGYDVAAGSTILNCWTSGVIGANDLSGQRIGGICGGLISQHTAIINCYSTMSILNSYAMGGIVGHANLDKNSADKSNANHPTKTSPYNTIQGCIAWNDEITSHATDSGNDHYSSGAIVGYTATHSYLRDCLYKSDISFTDYILTWHPYAQEDASPDVPLVVNSYTGKNYHYPYHGKPFDGTLSAAAISLGWDTDVWDLSGTIPVLTGATQTASTSSGASAVPAGDRDTGPRAPSEGNGWTVTTIRPGITYYHYDNKDYYGSYSGSDDYEKEHQDVFIVDVDLSNTDYEVKMVYSSPTAACSQVFNATKAIVAINAGYERSSIAIKANVRYDWEKMDTDAENNVLDNIADETITPYPNGVGISYMPNNTITDTGVPNWKSQGTVYFDGVRGVRLAFDGYDSAKAPGGAGNPPIKSVQDERFFYQFCTDDEHGLVSSAPMLIQNYNQVGRQFKTWYPKQSGEPSEAPNTHQTSKYPRTAVALSEDNHLLLFVCDGRYPANKGGVGMSAYWVTQFLVKYFNPQYALNLDGGGSSTMCVEGQGASDTHVVNYPWDNAGSGGNNHDHDGQRARDTFIVIVPAE